jgi:hypothetical protein
MEGQREQHEWQRADPDHDASSRQARRFILGDEGFSG